MVLVMVVVGLPVALAMLVVQSRGALLALLGWFGAVEFGFVGGFGGPLGLPWLVWWPLAGVFGWMFGRNVWVLWRGGWRRGWHVWRQVRLGVPDREML